MSVDKQKPISFPSDDTKEMRIIQINCNRSRHSHEVVHASAVKKGVDIIPANEPNKELVNNRPMGFPQ